MRRALLSIVALSFAVSAHAQRQFPGERLEYGVDHEAIINTSWAAVPEHLAWDAALVLGYSNDPLFTYQVTNAGNPINRDKVLIENRLAGHLTGSISLFEWIQLGVELPVLLFQQRDAARAPAQDAGDVGSFGLGDLRIYPKARVLRQRDGSPLDIGFQLPMTLPTGQFTDYFGETGFTFTPTLLASREWDAWGGTFRLAGNLGARMRTTPVALPDNQNTLGAELIGRAGASYVFYVDPERPTEVGLSAALAPQIDGFLQEIPVRSPAELLAEIDHTVWGPLGVLLGGAVGLSSGGGGPDYRVFAGLRYAPREGDKDGDGIPDRKDQCPDVPETKNGYLDDDGCPDDDDEDKDGVPFRDDTCPNEPEDKDGFQDEDGCPDDDNDGDGIKDSNDKCPNDAEDKDGFQDEDGCPDDDNDGDGIKDKDDKCPDAAEDKDGFQDEDGCPDDDNDGDGIKDKSDKCPNDAGPVENNGCPDTDRDGDGVVDRLDNCPDEKGTADNQGCAVKQLVVLTKEKIVILDKVFFKTGRDVIESKSFALLDNVAAVLNAHKEIDKIRVEGHTDDVGQPDKNKDLSDRRAKSVVKYLTNKGVDAARLVGVGYGQDKPIADNATDDGKAQNRRVEFAIVGDEE